MIKNKQKSTLINLLFRRISVAFYCLLTINEISNLEEVLDSADLPENIPLKADNGYPDERKLYHLSI
ncbi:MAG: hypothetical protein K8R37_01980 [Bacteroidales bacterium]|nr:hypothetical protein [Bacteroidales bacterium]